MVDNSSPLDGLRVLDLSSVIMGPYATRILADYGADVIKIEPPEGDMNRTPGGARLSPQMLNLWRNKRSVMLDLKTPRGREDLKALIPTADVFLHNLRPAVMARLGFGYDVVKGLRPDILYCVATGFGSGGPYAERPAYDDLIQAGSGFASTYVPLTGEPAYAPAIICDKLVGQALVGAVLAGLVHRLRTGEGQSIEVPMFETAIDFNMVEGLGDVVYVPSRGEPGYARIKSRERRPFRTADGFACILPYSTKNWFDFFDHVGRSDLKHDARFQSLPDRSKHFDLLYSIIREEAVSRTTAEWIAFCDSADIPSMPVLDVKGVLADAHVRAVEMAPVADHPTEGAYLATRSPVMFGASPYRLRRHAPTLGQHTREVLGELGRTAC